jgi:Tfp pilus assembly protein PilF
MQKAVADKDVPAIVWVNKAWIELMNNDNNAALSDVNKALKQDPYLKEGYAVRGMIEQKTGNASGANADNEKAKNLVSHYDV